MEHLGNPASAARIRQRLASVAPRDTGRWGVLRVDEMLCHVREAFRVTGTDAVPVRITSPLPPAMLKFFALRVPVPWPKLVQTVPAFKREALPAPEGFVLEQERLLNAFDFFLEEAGKRYAHPMFGGMTAWDWQRWGYLHADHHLRQFGR